MANYFRTLIKTLAFHLLELQGLDKEEKKQKKTTTDILNIDR